MSSPEKAYNQHLKDTIGYTGSRRQLETINFETLRSGATALRTNYGHESQARVRLNVSRELGISLDAFIGEHGTVDDDALERTARYVAKSARRLREQRGEYKLLYVPERAHRNHI